MFILFLRGKKIFFLCPLFTKILRIAEKHHNIWINAHLDNDAHPFTLRCEREGLKDVEGESLSRWSPQLQGVQVSIDQGQADTLSPPHQFDLVNQERKNKTSLLSHIGRFEA